MGEVWKARDTRLDRAVAIKVLPPELAQNTQLKLRFEREARAISQLEHPNICRLYDVGEDYLVMELLEGESLELRLARGPLPLSEALRYGAQIAAALDRAHRAGIVHRDLKPGNVVLTKTGAKLLDFGLARKDPAVFARSGPLRRSGSPAPSSGATPSPPTWNVLEGGHEDKTELRAEPHLTERGTIMGTLQYISPEQFDGEEADARSDIFALGAVLYEMVTGRAAFEAKTKASLIAAIISRPPAPLLQIQPLTPPALEHVIMKCLEKDPDDRWQSAHDVGQQLRWIAESGAQSGAVVLPGSPQKLATRRWVVAGAVTGWLAVVGLAILAQAYADKAADARRLLKTEIVLPLDNVVNAPVAVSPDGRRLAAVLVASKTANPLPSASEGEGILAIRDLSSDDVRRLAGTEGATYPFWAPDGGSVGFFAGGKLKTVNVESGAINEVCDAPNGRGGSWSPHGVIVFTANTYSPLMRVADTGGTPVATVRVPAGVSRPIHRNPQFLPDGRRFFYTAGDHATLGRAVLRVGSTDGSVDQQVLDHASNVALIDGWLISAREPNLVARRFDEDTLRFQGKPVPIARNVDWYWARFQAYFSAGGSTLVFRRPASPVMHFLRLGPGEVHPVEIRQPGTYNAPRVSPDGRSLIVNRFDASTRRSDPWLFEIESATWTRMTFTADAAGDDSAVFAPDGQRIAIASSRNVRSGLRELWIQPFGGGNRQRIAAGTDYIVLTDWSPDGGNLVVGAQRAATGFDIEVIDANRGGRLVPLVRSNANEINGRVSPDGRWLVYESDEMTRAEIFVTSFPSGTGKWQVSNEGGRSPYWSADGREIIFLNEDRVMRASVRAGPTFAADVPRPLEALGDRIAAFSVARSGAIIALRVIDEDKPPLNVVVNWQAMLGGE